MPPLLYTLYTLACLHDNCDYRSNLDDVVSPEHISKELQDEEAEEGGHIDLSHDWGDEIAEQVQVRIRHLHTSDFECQ